MSKCILCGNELLTGDIHWQSGMCNKCWDEHYAVKGGVPLDKFYSELYIDLLKDYRKLEQQLAEKDNLIKEINQAYIETYKREREKDKEIEELKAFMDKWHFKDFEDFEKHYNYLMTLKNREQLANENEALKDTIAVVLAQKKNVEKNIRKQVCDAIREKLKAHCDYTDEENIGWYLTEHKIDILLDQIEQAKEQNKRE